MGSQLIRHAAPIWGWMLGVAWGPGEVGKDGILMVPAAVASQQNPSGEYDTYMDSYQKNTAFIVLFESQWIWVNAAYHDLTVGECCNDKFLKRCADE